MGKKLAIFTAVFGAYDDITAPEHFDTLREEADFYCFTDNAGLASNHYKMIVVKPLFKDPQRNARYYKVTGYASHLQAHDFCLWIDCNSAIVTRSFSGLLNDYGKNDIVVNIHSDRNCLYDEAKWVIAAKRDMAFKVRRQVKYMQDRHFPANYGLAATNFLLRKNNAVVAEFNRLWWSMIKKGSKRDQLSFDYCRWVLRDKMAFSFLHHQWNNNQYTVTHTHAKKYVSHHVFTTPDYVMSKLLGAKRRMLDKLRLLRKPHLKAANRIRLVMDKQYKAMELERIRLKSLPRYTEAEVPFLDRSIRIVDIASFRFIQKEIFGQGIYRFKSGTNAPYIIDCGANIGLSIIYFKQFYPDAEIIGFEPDEKVFSVLKFNIDTFRLSNITLVKKACWNEETTLQFFHEGADAGRTANEGDGKNVTTVETVRLRDYLQRKVDFLKIDIEGAENQVVPDIQDLLGNVDKIFVEFHSFTGQEQMLPELLTILKQAGFRLHISAPGLSSQSPFMNLVQYAGMDNQLNIYGFR